MSSSSSPTRTHQVSARWLPNVSEEQELRHIDFDFDALCRKVLALSGSSSIADCEKIEGSSNRVFKFTFSDSKPLIAKLPFKEAGPAYLMTASEVATIKYSQPTRLLSPGAYTILIEKLRNIVQRRTSIPVPKVLEWKATIQNEIRSEYIIMEHASGALAGEKWPSMTLMQRLRFMENLYRKLQAAHHMRFRAYGSIYFDNDLEKFPYPTQPLTDGFCIGPHCGQRWWDCGRETFHNQHKQITRGPWPDIQAYINAIVDAGLAKLPPTNPDPHSLEIPLPFYQGSVETHVQLLDHARIVLNQMASDNKVKLRSDRMLFHRDLQLRHIFVSDEDPTVITGIIDWQSASIEPAFEYSFSTPDFVPQRTETASEQKSTETAVLRTEESNSQSDPNTREAEKQSDLLQKLWDTVVTLYAPQISVARATHIGLFRLFRICDDSWYNGAIKLQNELVQLRRHWNWLGLSGECSYPQQSDEFLTRHTDRYDLYERITSMREGLI